MCYTSRMSRSSLAFSVSLLKTGKPLAVAEGVIKSRRLDVYLMVGAPALKIKFCAVLHANAKVVPMESLWQNALKGDGGVALTYLLTL